MRDLLKFLGLDGLPVKKFVLTCEIGHPPTIEVTTDVPATKHQLMTAGYVLAPHVDEEALE